MDHPDAVPEGRRHEDRRVGAESEALHEGDVEGRESVAGVHDRLREPGGAGGEHEVVQPLDRPGVVVVASSAGRARFRSGARPHPAPPPVVAGDRHRRPAGALPRRRDGELPGPGPTVPLDGDDCARAAELDRVSKGGLVHPNRQAGGDRAPAERGECRHQRLDPVRHEDEDDVARSDPPRRKLGAEPAGFPPERLAAEAAPPVVEHRERRRPRPHEALEALRERHPRPPAALAVAARALRLFAHHPQAARPVHPVTPAALNPGSSRSSERPRSPRSPRPGSTISRRCRVQ